MKKILLIGDSIRQGYDKYVKAAFEGSAQVYYPEENCQFSTYVLRHFIDWKKRFAEDGNIDLVHWNVGLWDDLLMLDGKHLVSFELYQDNIERICNLIPLLFPKAKVIFATSTHVQEELFTECKRYNCDTEKYNQAAMEIVKAHGGKINDLYALTKDFPAWYHSDMTHFYTREATERISDQVIDSIEKSLAIKSKKLDYDRLFASDEKVVGI